MMLRTGDVHAVSNRYCIYKKEDIASTQHHTTFNILDYRILLFYYFTILTSF
jgi:hypothetical protein